MIASHDITSIPIGKMRSAEWNANKVSKRMLDKLRQSVRLFGVVENNVVRPSWCIGAKTASEVRDRKLAAALDDDVWYETLSGNHRLSIYREEGLGSVLSIVVELTDPLARMLAQALNRLKGDDDPDRLKALLQDVLETERPADVAALLPHSERDLLKLLDDASDEDAPEAESGPVDSRLGVIYQLGPHRLMCGDATCPDAVSDLLQGSQPILMATDPPYGVSLDQGWRDRVSGMERNAPGTAQVDSIAGDDGFSWVPALGLGGCKVAYVWHADKYCSQAHAALTSYSYEIRQQIIWMKAMHVIGRASYHWKHEPCWYAVKSGETTPWYGGRNQATVWEAASPRQASWVPVSDADDSKQDHPTQKPLSLWEIPIVNHLLEGEAVYDPFCGSGPSIIAAAKTRRVAYAAEINPAYVDLVRRRWGKWAEANGQDPGQDAL